MDAEGRIAGWARIGFAAGAIGLGLVTLLYHSFLLQWQPVPDWVPQPFVWLSGGLLIIGGAALVLRKGMAWGGLLLGLFLAIWVLALKLPEAIAVLPKITKVTSMIGTWLGTAESASMTLGNPRLEPIRSKNYDLAVEWYFNKNSLLSAALFYKEIKDFSQTISYTAALSTLLNADEITALRSNSTNANYQAYLQADSPVTVRQTRNAPGGFLRGWEINYQQPFTFLPWKLKNTGLLLNLTHVDSKLKYILDPGSPQTTTAAATPVVYGNGPWLGASPDALNATLYYSTDTIDARISVSKRSDYYDTFPISAGNCSPGLNPVGTTATSQAYCTSPLILDFAGVKGTTNVDAKVTYNFTQHLAFTLEGLNLTNQTTNKFAYVANPVVTNYSSTGRQITVGVRYRY